MSVRSGEPATDDALLAEVAGDPVTVPVRPAALSAAATTTLVRARLGEDADQAFADACHETTGGNPLLVGQLLAALADERVTPDAAHAAEVRAIGPRAVSRTVLLRLARLPQPGRRTRARRRRARRAARAAGCGRARAGSARRRRPRPPACSPRRTSCGPASRSASSTRSCATRSTTSSPAAQRGLEHARAARVLERSRAGADQIAAQLLARRRAATPGSSSACARPRAVALVRGAPESAIAYLERAQAEPPPAEQRAALALELGDAAQYVAARRRCGICARPTTG